MSETDSELRSEIAGNESRSEWGAWAVVVGLVLEIAIALAISVGIDKKWIANWGAVLADCLIALGVYSEIHFGRKASRGNTELRRRSDEKVAAANERAAKAELETQRLKGQFAWRQILPEQETSLRFWLAKFTSGSVIIRWFMYDLESQNLAEDIGAIFRLSGWKARLSPEAYSGNFAYGLRISSPFAQTPSQDEENKRATETVQEAFINSHVDFEPLSSPRPHMMTGAHGDDISSPCAELYVGPKPPPNNG